MPRYLKNTSTIKVILVAILTFNFPPGANADEKFNDESISAQKAMYNAAACHIDVNIDTWFGPLEKIAGESNESYGVRLTSAQTTDIRARASGWSSPVESNVKALLATKVRSLPSLKIVESPKTRNRVLVEIRIGANTDPIFPSHRYRTDVRITLQEEASSILTGVRGYIDVHNFYGKGMGVGFSSTEAEIEATIYQALDRAVANFEKNTATVADYCSDNDCKL